VHFPLARKMPTIATDRPSEKLHLLGESKLFYYFIILLFYYFIHEYVINSVEPLSVFIYAINLKMQELKSGNYQSAG
ncbi:hypothetical protein KKJ25_22640, partial [Xenorhabdus bovienii]|uniref:hypothetical protein n=1 Tax=Xenorhabdus bovienii TaxID=40576 RepID=UPI00237CD10B